MRDSIVFEPLAVSSLAGFEALPSDSKRELAELKLVALRLLSSLKDLVVVSYYNPPPTNQSKNKNKKRELSSSIFKLLSKTRPGFLLVGDLNAHLKTFGSTEYNHNGRLLEEIIENNNLLIVNNRDPTYHGFSYDKCAILNYCICSSNIYQKTFGFEVLLDSAHDSDHDPFVISIRKAKSPFARAKIAAEHMFDYKKADWNVFTQSLEITTEMSYTSCVDKLNELIVSSIKKACNKAIPKKSARFGSVSQPPYPAHIIEHIKARQNAMYKYSDNKTESNRAFLNKKTAEFRLA